MAYRRTYAKVSLDAVESNINNVIEKTKTKVLGVIKADAYGHGAVEIAHLLKDKCAFFGVACIEEAVELRKSGIENPILLLGYTSPNVYDLAVKYDIRVAIFSEETAAALSKEAKKQGKTVPFHFALDTGMSRIGFQITEQSALECQRICRMPNIEAEGMFSHFATADEADLSKALAQREAFKRFDSMLKSLGINIPIKHLNNSAGLMNFDEYFDMVRSGIITYGLYPSEDVDKSLLKITPAMEWITHISHIKTLEPGREISYGGIFKTQKPTRVATIPVGYADGYPRSLSNNFRVIVNGKFAPILGRVCMDQFMVDITNIDGVNVEDKVTLFGKDGDCEIPIEEIANASGSFNYEFACRLSRRVPRVYYYNSKEIKEVNYLLSNPADYVEKKF